MSARIVNGAERVRPFRPRALDGSAAPDTSLPEPQVLHGRGSIHPEHVTELHARIADLEASLLRDVRHAREAGYREGEKAAHDHATAELQPVMERLNRTLVSIAGLRASIRREAEQDLVRLSLAIAGRILRRELSVDPDAIQGIVRAALDKVQSRDVCRIRIHPGFLQQVRRTLESASMPPGVELTADPSLQPGDVIVETRRGDLDGTIEGQLLEIERGFADRLRR